MTRRIKFNNFVSEAYSACGGLDKAAEIMDVSRATANRWRKDDKIPKLDSVKKIASKIGWPIEWFALGQKV